MMGSNVAPADTNEPFTADRNLIKVAGEPSLYHFEYTSLHNQRVALVRLMHLWHQIGLPAALVVMGFFFKAGIDKNSSLLVTFGATAATMMVVFVRIYTRGLFNIVAELYPRIITIEIMLDYHFMSNHVMNRTAHHEVRLR